ncbi:MAG TPA: hypothetical protein VHK01_00995 [Lacipirellulaceae bacterium]|nr:hypothetical protein [Lacipirellulaceae bacterium]
MATHLQAIHPDMMWEFGRAVKGPGHRLVITPESARHLRPLTASILKRAPQLAGWEFYGYRLPENVEMTHQTVKVRTGFDSSEFKVRLQANEMNRIDVCYFASNVADAEDQDALHGAFVASETLLGEELLDKWVGGIEVSPIKKSSGLGSLFRRGDDEPKHLIPLDRMKETFDAVIRSIHDQLSPEPYFKWIANAQCSVYELKPEEAEDYPQQWDLFVGISAAPQVWTAAHSGGVFYSSRYSRCGEIFCYLKIDRSEGLENSKFADRSEIEDRITGLLTQHGLGCHVGGGTGLRYSYIELALTDLPRGIQAVRQVLQAVQIPIRSWILFDDSDLVAEWVGIYDDSPPPPMPNFDA